MTPMQRRPDSYTKPKSKTKPKKPAKPVYLSRVKKGGTSVPPGTGGVKPSGPRGMMPPSTGTGGYKPGKPPRKMPVDRRGVMPTSKRGVKAMLKTKKKTK